MAPNGTRVVASGVEPGVEWRRLSEKGCASRGTCRRARQRLNVMRAGRIRAAHARLEQSQAQWIGEAMHGG
jgi:hypothetical protein